MKVQKFDIEIHGAHSDRSMETIKKTVYVSSSSGAYKIACDLAVATGLKWINFISVGYHLDPDTFPIEVI